MKLKGIKVNREGLGAGTGLLAAAGGGWRGLNLITRIYTFFLKRKAAPYVKIASG